MAQSGLNHLDSVIYEYLVDRLIFQNKIKVVEEKERHCQDIIEKI